MGDTARLTVTPWSQVLWPDDRRIGRKALRGGRGSRRTRRDTRRMHRDSQRMPRDPRRMGSARRPFVIREEISSRESPRIRRESPRISTGVATHSTGVPDHSQRRPTMRRTCPGIRQEALGRSPRVDERARTSRLRVGHPDEDGQTPRRDRRWDERGHSSPGE
jgi:hypothetical protein